MVLTQQNFPPPGAPGETFPYHYGSHATQRQSRHLRQPDLVSIPLWFSRNELYDVFDGSMKCSFPYHYGSHATRYLWGLTSCLPCFHTTMVLTQLSNQGNAFLPLMPVSIPLWFSRNIPTLLCLRCVWVCFHTTMVLTQRVLRVLKRSNVM